MIAHVERIETQRIDGSGRTQAQGIYVSAAPSHDRDIIGDRFERLGWVPDRAFDAGGRNRHLDPTAEIDIVAYDGAVLCFIEVKTRASDWFAPPQANVDVHKQRQIARAARVYRRMLDLVDEPYRYDVLSLILPASDIEEPEVAPGTTLLKNFWSDGKFRKRRWSDATYD